MYLQQYDHAPPYKEGSIVDEAKTKKTKPAVSDSRSDYFNLIKQPPDPSCWLVDCLKSNQPITARDRLLPRLHERIENVNASRVPSWPHGLQNKQLISE